MKVDFFFSVFTLAKLPTVRYLGAGQTAQQPGYLQTFLQHKPSSQIYSEFNTSLKGRHLKAGVYNLPLLPRAKKNGYLKMEKFRTTFTFVFNENFAKVKENFAELILLRKYEEIFFRSHPSCISCSKNIFQAKRTT